MSKRSNEHDGNTLRCLSIATVNGQRGVRGGLTASALGGDKPEGERQRERETECEEYETDH